MFSSKVNFSQGVPQFLLPLTTQTSEFLIFLSLLIKDPDRVLGQIKKGRKTCYTVSLTMQNCDLMIDFLVYESCTFFNNKVGITITKGSLQL